MSGHRTGARSEGPDPSRRHGQVPALKSVEVLDYDGAWALAFDGLHAGLWAALSDIAISVEHVGSTAVPGLAAKPVIDIDVVVVPSRTADAIARLASLGYEHRGDLGVPQREAFRSPVESPRHHLYLCPPTSPALANHIAVRDHLRADPAEARAYGVLKKRLAQEFRHDGVGYSVGKTSYLVAMLRRLGFAEDALSDIERMNRRPG